MGSRRALPRCDPARLRDLFDPDSRLEQRMGHGAGLFGGLGHLCGRFGRGAICGCREFGDHEPRAGRPTSRRPTDTVVFIYAEPLPLEYLFSGEIESQLASARNLRRLDGRQVGEAVVTAEVRQHAVKPPRK